MEEKIVSIINEMADYLNISQMKKLQEVLLKTFSDNQIKKRKFQTKNTLDFFWKQKGLRDVPNERFNITKSQ